MDTTLPSGITGCVVTPSSAHSSSKGSGSGCTSADSVKPVGDTEPTKTPSPNVESSGNLDTTTRVLNDITEFLNYLSIPK